ncbi:hypothetical protein JT359_03885 [Candidatus Poribacteria bacterium]|nr:hypothetical protein [Candidatus Poribacteria bacterium]
MSNLSFSYTHNQFTKTIQLYGDRAGGQGNFEFAGLVELQSQKILLVHGISQSLEEIHDWRRLSRLIHLAKKLQLPIALWNLPLLQSSIKLHKTSLALSTVIGNVQTEILRFPHPIIAIFDESNDTDIIVKELDLADGFAVVSFDKQTPTEISVIKKDHLKILNKQEDLQMEILNLLNELSKISTEELIKYRIDRFNIS